MGELNPSGSAARKTAMDKQDILYFDGSCPMCSAEMNRLGRLSDDGLCLVDIHSTANHELPEDREQLLEILHMTTADGRVLTGVEANVAAWQHTRLGVLLRFLRWPIIRQIADFFYKAWASRRYRRLYSGE